MNPSESPVIRPNANQVLLTVELVLHLTHLDQGLTISL